MARDHTFAIGEKYHIYNRGTEKRKIFLDKYDYQRFLFILNSFNNENRGYNISRDLSVKDEEKRKAWKTQKPLVKIEDYCLMPNHYHLIVEQLEDGGISKFLQKVMTGYTMYFNKKYKRNGALFQGKTKSKHIDTEAYYLQMKIYLNLNPVGLFDKNWKKRGKVRSVKDTMNFLNKYNWCSCRNYKNYEKYISDSKEVLYLEDLF